LGCWYSWPTDPEQTGRNNEDTEWPKKEIILPKVWRLVEKEKGLQANLGNLRIIVVNAQNAAGGQVYVCHAGIIDH